MKKASNPPPPEGQRPPPPPSPPEGRLQCAWCGYIEKPSKYNHRCCVHRWIEIHREPTGPVISSLMTEPTEYKECSYIQHEYCSICRQSRRVQMPSGSIFVDSKTG